MLNVKPTETVVCLPASPGHPAVPALQLIGGVGGCVCGENVVDGTQPGDVNGGDCWRGKHVNGGEGLKQLHQPLNWRERERERENRIPKQRRGEEKLQQWRHKRKNRGSSARLRFQCARGKEGGSPLLRWTPSKCANLCLFYLLHQNAFFFLRILDCLLKVFFNNLTWTIFRAKKKSVLIKFPITILVIHLILIIYFTSLFQNTSSYFSLLLKWNDV